MIINSEDIYHLSLAAAVCGLLGTVLLSFALSRWMSAISLSLTALETFKDTSLSGGPVLNFKGADKHRSRAANCSQLLTYGGLFLIVIATAIQVGVLYFSSVPKTMIITNNVAKKTVAGNGSYGNCRIVEASCSPSPDAKR